VALVLAESLDPGAGGDIPVAAMDCAVTITRYVMDCWRSMEAPEVLAYSRKDEVIYRAVRAWEDAARDNGGRISTRELQRRHTGGIRDKDKFLDVLEAYENYHPGSVVTEPTGHGGTDVTWVSAPSVAVSPRPKVPLRSSKGRIA
jgi:hypothetical protein